MLTSTKHLRFISTIIYDSLLQEDLLDCNLLCQDGEVSLNKLVVGILFPELANSQEFLLGLTTSISLPLHTRAELEAEFQFNFHLDDVLPEEYCHQDLVLTAADYDSLDTRPAAGDHDSWYTPPAAGGHDSLNTPQAAATAGDNDSLVTPQAAATADGQARIEQEHLYPATEKTSGSPTCLEEIITELVVDGELEAIDEYEPSEDKGETIFVTIKEEEEDEEERGGGEGEPEVDEAASEGTLDKQTQLRGEDVEGKRKRGAHECLVCGKIFPYRTKLEAHLTIHTRPFTCTDCNAAFSSRVKLARHTLQEHGYMDEAAASQLYRCPQCPNRFFPAQSQLDQHVRTHTAERPFRCSECGKRFSVKYNLTVHARIHTGESKVYPCRYPPCTRKFSHTSERKDHEGKHTGDKPFHCVCGESYQRGSNLWRHKQKCRALQPILAESTQSARASGSVVDMEGNQLSHQTLGETSGTAGTDPTAKNLPGTDPTAENLAGTDLTAEHLTETHQKLAGTAESAETA